MKQTEKLASAMYLVKSADISSLIQDAMRGAKRMAYSDQEILDAPVAKLKDQITLANVGAGGDLLGGAGGAGGGYLLGKLLSGPRNAGGLLGKLLSGPRNAGGLLARLLGAGLGGFAGAKLNDPWQQEDLINKKLDLGYPQGLNLSVKK